MPPALAILFSIIPLSPSQFSQVLPLAATSYFSTGEYQNQKGISANSLSDTTCHIGFPEPEVSFLSDLFFFFSNTAHRHGNSSVIRITSGLPARLLPIHLTPEIQRRRCVLHCRLAVTFNPASIHRSHPASVHRPKIPRPPRGQTKH